MQDSEILSRFSHNYRRHEYNIWWQAIS